MCNWLEVALGHPSGGYPVPETALGGNRGTTPQASGWVG